MPTLGAVVSWIFLLLIFGVFALMVYHGYDPKNRISTVLTAVWNAPAVKDTRRFLRVAFWLVLVSVAHHDWRLVFQ
jgi:hypothetical protein